MVDCLIFIDLVCVVSIANSSSEIKNCSEIAMGLLRNCKYFREFKQLMHNHITFIGVYKVD